MIQYHQLSRFDLPYIFGIQQIERATFGGHYPGVTKPSQAQGAKSMGIARGDNALIGHQHH